MPDGLRVREPRGGASDLAELSRCVAEYAPDLVAGDNGYAALTAELSEGRSAEEVAFLVRFAALSRLADDYQMGPDYAGWYVSENPPGTLVYAGERFAEPSTWQPVAEPAEAAALTYDDETGLYYDAENWYLPDGQTVVTPDPDSPEWFRDTAGNLYYHGEPWTGAAETEAAQETPAAADAPDVTALGDIVALSLNEALELVPGAGQLSPEQLQALVAEVLDDIRS